MQVASLDWLPSQASPIFFSPFELMLHKSFIQMFIFFPFMPLAQKLLCDTAAISGKFQVTGEGSCGAPARELFRKKNHHCSRVQRAITHLTKLQLDFSHRHRQKNVFRGPGKLKALFAVVCSSIREDYGGSLDVYP